MKKSRILREAYKLIESGKEYFVCLAIDEIGYNAIYAKSNSRKLLDQIEKRFQKDGLEPESCVMSWLRTVHGVAIEDMTEENMRTYRLAWLDNWASELEAKGE